MKKYKSKNGETALTIACDMNNPRIVEFLLQNGACDLRTKKESSLISAIKNRYIDVIKLLVEYRKELINRSYMEETPLMIACEYLDVDIVDYLLKNGANINGVNMCEETALSYAFFNKNKGREIVIGLIDNGINMETIMKNERFKSFIYNTKDIRLKTIWSIRTNGIGGIKNLLNGLDHMDKEKCLVYLMTSQYFNKIIDNIKVELKSLLEENSDVIHEMIKGCKKRTRHEEKRTKTYSVDSNFMMLLMHNFCEIGNLDIVKSIVNIGININKKDRNGLSALMCSCKENQLNIVRYLLSLDVCIDDVSLNKETALMYAINNDFDIVRELIEHKANINLSNSKGETPLMMAIVKKDVNLVKYLLKHGADVSAKDLEGRGIINYAINSGDMKMVNCLKEYIKTVKKEPKQKISIVSNFERIKKNEDILNIYKNRGS